jgi:4'-phosphopantetheinyl transferase
VLVSGAHGKPFMPDAPGLHFSLTHTAGLTAVALHTCEVGCDAERADRQVAETVFSMLAREERAWLRALDPGPARQRAFIRLWVVKEAFAKALGLGLSLDPRTYAFDLSDGSARLSRAPPGHTDSNWGFVARTVGSAHVLALAVRGILGSAEMEIPRLVAAGEIARAAAGGPPFGMS